MANQLLKHVQLNDGTILDICDEVARGGGITKIKVGSVDDCPDCCVWMEEGVPTQGKLLASLANENAIYLVPIDKLDTDEESAEDNVYIEYYVFDNNWERYSGKIPAFEDIEVAKIVEGAEFDPHEAYIVNGYLESDEPSELNNFTLRMSAINYSSVESVRLKKD